MTKRVKRIRQKLSSAKSSIIVETAVHDKIKELRRDLGIPMYEIIGEAIDLYEDKLVKEYEAELEAKISNDLDSSLRSRKKRAKMKLEADAAMKAKPRRSETDWDDTI